MKIILKYDIPVVHRHRRVPYPDESVIDNQIEEWLEDGIIEHSYSEYLAPVVLDWQKYTAFVANNG